MATGNFGFGAMTKSALGNPKQLNSSKNVNKEIILRVTDIILDENHSLWDPLGGFSQLGTVIGNQTNIDGTVTNNIFTARPAFNGVTKTPLINEYVKAYKHITPNNPAGSFVYTEIIPVWGMISPNASPFPTTTTNLTPPSQNLSYAQVEAGAFNIPNNTIQEIPLNSINSISQNTFIEKSNIHPLMPYSGDVIYEGRWGNSIRFSSTARSKSKLANLWSSSGPSGDPITIIRNGQDKRASEFGAEPITENIQNDLSSIYLTSTQALPYSLSGLKNKGQEFTSYSGLFPPLSTTSYISPQILLNSDRIIIDAQSNDVLISANRSVGLFSNESINLESNKIYMSANEIRLGINESEGGEQPILRGDKTVELLIDLVTIVQGLSEIIKHTRNYPIGTDTPDSVALIVGGQASYDLKDMIKILKDEKEGIKSRFVKSI